MGMSLFEAEFLPLITTVFPKLSLSSRLTMSPGTSVCLVYEILPHDPGARGESGAGLAGLS